MGKLSAAQTPVFRGMYLRAYDFTPGRSTTPCFARVRTVVCTHSTRRQSFKLSSKDGSDLGATAKVAFH